MALHNQAVEDRQTLLIPTKYAHIPISKLATEDLKSPLLQFQPKYDGFLEMVHDALMLIFDIMAQPRYEGFNVNEDDAISCVLDIVYMFLRLLFGGQTLLHDEPVTDEDNTPSKNECQLQNIILSIGQDLVYNVSGGKKWTPKHSGLQLFHNAGHIISHDSVLQVDSAMAESTVKYMNINTGAVITPNLLNNRFVYFSCDNIAISDSSLDGKDTFHATQVAAWQRGAPSHMGFRDLRPSSTTTLKVAEVMEVVLSSKVTIGRVEPLLSPHMKVDWFNKSADTTVVRNAEACDMAFFGILKKEFEQDGQTSTK